MAAEIEKFYQSLGRRLRKVRNDLGLTQAQLGQRLTPPVTRASIANIEAGKQRILAHTLVDLARALGIKVSKLTGATAPPVEPDLRKALERELEPDRVQELVQMLDQPGQPE